ncbi:MAG: DUF3124 domain-containing protein [Planctomycetaceae bacterium]|nr:DUF3124 domain-containing protein [Planctomycetaceae bacterium]
MDKVIQMAKDISSVEFDTFLRQIKWLAVGFVALFVVPLIVYAFQMDRRLRSFEDTLRYQPPQETAIEEQRTAGDMTHMATNPVLGQVVYVPAYSHIYHGDGDPYLLTITLSIRNTSIDNEIVVRSVRYFGTKGNEVKSYFAKPIRVPPLGTTEVLVERDDATGGSGASFLVEWLSDKPVTEPIIEAVMIGTKSENGISFARRGSVLSEVEPGTPKNETSLAEPASGAALESE